MYAHPIEFIVGNLLGVVLGPMLTRCHPLTSFVWIHNALMSTGGSHSGYKMFYADFHDAHHQYFDYNYGIGNSTSFSPLHRPSHTTTTTNLYILFSISNYFI